MNKKLGIYLFLSFMFMGSLCADDNLIFESTINFFKICRSGTFDEVVEQVNHGADLNACDLDGNTALITLMYRFYNNESYNITKFLLERGVDVNQTNKFGTTALMKAVDHKSYTCRCNLIQLLLDNGIDVNASDKCGSTALMIAAGNGHLQSVQLLLAAGANVHAQTIDGKTALNICQRAAYNGRFGWNNEGNAVVKLLKAAAKNKVR